MLFRGTPKKQHGHYRRAQLLDWEKVAWSKEIFRRIKAELKQVRMRRRMEGERVSINDEKNKLTIALKKYADFREVPQDMQA